jgi:hypothetical protein
MQRPKNHQNDIFLNLEFINFGNKYLRGWCLKGVKAFTQLSRAYVNPLIVINLLNAIFKKLEQNILVTTKIENHFK